MGALAVVLAVFTTQNRGFSRLVYNACCLKPRQRLRQICTVQFSENLKQFLVLPNCITFIRCIIYTTNFLFNNLFYLNGFGRRRCVAMIGYMNCDYL